MPGLSATDCTDQAELLERLADDEPEAFRAEAYRQMAAYWRALARVRAAALNTALAPKSDDEPDHGEPRPTPPRKRLS